MLRWVALAALLLVACGSTKIEQTACPDGGAAGAAAGECDSDGDGYESKECGGDDCDDTRADIHPGAADVCDGDDNDCDGVVDADDACDCADPPSEPTIELTDRVCLKGGWFAMGMGITDPQAADIAWIATPIHRVFVAPFYMDAYEVTNRRFIECLDARACKIEVPAAVPSAIWKRDENSTDDQLDRPYWGAGAKGAEDFCQWAGGWLPSEAQWERAAAGLGETPEKGEAPRPFPHGNYPPTCEEEWTADCFPADQGLIPAQPVGQLAPNPEGIFDLGGNVKEWTADLFSLAPYESCPEPCKNPCFGCAAKTGGDQSLAPDQQPWPWGHVIRGGVLSLLFPSKPDNLVFFRSQARDEISSDADAAYPDVFNQGFRCAYPAAARH